MAGYLKRNRKRLPERKDIIYNVMMSGSKAHIAQLAAAIAGADFHRAYDPGIISMLYKDLYAIPEFPEDITGFFWRKYERKT